MNVTGESFDYGPYRFSASTIRVHAAYFDHSGLYAYERQPASVLWNLQRFADTWPSCRRPTRWRVRSTASCRSLLRAWREGCCAVWD